MVRCSASAAASDRGGGAQRGLAGEGKGPASRTALCSLWATPEHSVRYVRDGPQYFFYFWSILLESYHAIIFFTIKWMQFLEGTV